MLTALGVAAGVWSVTSMLGVAAGAYSEATAVIGRLGAEMISVFPAFDWEKRAPAVRLARDDAAAIASLPNVRAAIIHEVHTLTMRRGGEDAEVSAQGWTGEATPHWLWKAYELGEGRHLIAADDFGEAAVVVLSAPVRERLFGTQANPIGEPVVMAGRTFTVVGAYAPHAVYNTRLYRDERGLVDDNVWVPFSVLENWPAPKPPDGIEVRLVDPALMEKTLADIQDALVRRHGQEKTVVRAQVDNLRYHDRMVRARAGVLGGLGAVGLVAGGLGIVAAMLASVAQRRREIALRMAVGARRRDVARQFLAESMTVGVVGALAGAAIGFATGAVVETETTPVAFPPWVVGSAIGIAIAVSALFGIVPARRAAAVDAAEELAAD